MCPYIQGVPLTGLYDVKIRYFDGSKEYLNVIYTEVFKIKILV